jgi:hypothetical protein
MNAVDASKGLDRDIRARLHSDEIPIVVASLRIPKQYTPGASWFGIIVFVRLFDEIRNIIKMRSFRRRFEEIQFSIARRTTVCVTDRRILLWKHSSSRSSNYFLGSVDRSRVASSHVAPSTHVKWKVITIQLREGPQIRFLIDTDSSGQLSDELNKGV